MNRQILFRGKNIDGGWVYGDLIYEIHKWKPINTPSLHFRENNESNGSFIRVNKETVGQFTELKDKNGVNIFEDDICKVGKYIGVVGFSHGCYNISGIAISFRIERAEVLGNIHDNPELLNL